MPELDVYCPKCCESRGRRIGDRIVCVACGYEKPLKWVQGQQEDF